MKRSILIGAGLVTLVGLLLLFWPSQKQQTGYPITSRLLGDQPQPLWELSPKLLGQHASRDRVRLEHHIKTLRRSVAQAQSRANLLQRDDVEELSDDERMALRMLWWDFVEPIIALDALKNRYAAWWGIDYLHHPEQHAVAYSLSFASLCAQIGGGHALLDIVEGNSRVQRLFDEAVPERGLPAGSFTAIRNKLSQFRDQSLVTVGREWFDQWIILYLTSENGKQLRSLVHQQSQLAASKGDVKGMLSTLRNKSELIKTKAFQAWFPVQKEAAEWFGDVRVIPQKRRLIQDVQLDAMRKAMLPGDIIVERRNWYLSNIGLPGFWPHAALYIGSVDEVSRHFDDEEEVTQAFGTPFSEYLRSKHKAAFDAFAKSTRHHKNRVLEAVSEGVVFTSLEHSCGADYVGVMRVNTSKLELAKAIDKAFGYFGRPYDFDFDFATDDTLVCSELVVKAYAPVLSVPSIEVAGRTTIPPTEFVRAFANQTDEQGQLQFVYFLDGVELGQNAELRNASQFAASATRPKWDLLQLAPTK